MRERGNGFTLIELLVVIAIIAILAAILFPVFVSVKLKSKDATCQSNIRQVGMACLLYTDDYNGFGPRENIWQELMGTHTDAYDTQTDVTKGCLWSYIKNAGVRNGKATSNVARCPLAKRIEVDRNGPKRFVYPMWSYCLNGWLTKSVFNYIMYGTPYFGKGFEWSGVKYSIFTDPRRLPMMVDDNTDPDKGVYVNDTVFCYSDQTSFAHGEKANIFFLDGHVGKLKGGLVWSDAKYPDGKFVFRPTPP